ncbi:MAG: lactoylglutathione lyase [Gammaproteobacteria bacterium]|nr:MAG: lactoylglutathione lyase [Gammaproteobacteria bacterium]
MVHGMHHVNFIVRDLAQAIPVWERVLGRSVDSRDQLDGRGVDIARFDVGGTWIVLVQPTGPGVPADYLATHGEGFFLMSFGVTSLADESKRVGADLLEGLQRGGLDDWLVQDLDIAQTFGAQLQFVEG